MFYCEECDREFKSRAGLTVHMKQKHGRMKQATEVPRSSQDTHCPVCGFEIPFTTCCEDTGYTVCPKCLSMFDKQSKQIVYERGALLKSIGGYANYCVIMKVTRREANAKAAWTVRDL